MADYVGSSVDVMIFGYNDGSYATARSTAYSYHDTAFYISDSLGQHKVGTEYFVYRQFFKFDTSAIPDGATILSKKLRLTAYSDESNTDFDVEILAHDWSGSDPITNANKETPYDGCLAVTDKIVWRNTSGMSLNTPYESPELDYITINKTGLTYLSLRSNRDKAGTAPVGPERISIYHVDIATAAYRPYLVITYSTTKISKISGVAHTSIKKVALVAIGSAKKVAGVDNT